MCVLSGVCLCEVCAQWSVFGVCVVSGVFLCVVSALWILSAVSGVCLCEVSALCNVCGEWYVCVRRLHCGVCIC